MTTERFDDYLVAVEHCQTEHRDKLLNALEQLAITKAEISYTGGGDSGQVCEIETEPPFNKAALSQVHYTVLQPHYARDEQGGFYALKAFELSLWDALESFALNAVSCKHRGWEINDGGDGVLTIDVTDRHIHLAHCEYYTEATHYEHEL